MAYIIEVVGEQAVIASLSAHMTLAVEAVRRSLEEGGFIWERFAKHELEPPIDTGRTW